MLQKLGRISLILIGVLVALVLGEILARLLGPPFDSNASILGSLHQCDRLVGWRGIPNLSTTLNTDDQYEHKVIWNSWGMHDGEHSTQKEDGVFRILMLGDSFVQASEVEESQTSHQVLEDILNLRYANNPTFEVISGATLAWGPAQELMYYRTEGQTFQPDLILAVWVPANDLRNVLPDHIFTASGINCYAPYFVQCNNKFDAQPWFSAPGISPTYKNCSVGKKTMSSILNFLHAYSKLYQLFAPALTADEKSITYASNYSPWISQDQSDEILDYSYQLTTDIYTQLNNEVTQQGAKTAFVIAPFSQTLYYELDPAFQASLIAEIPLLENGNPTLPNQRFTALMAQRNLPVLDLHPLFKLHYKNNGEPLHWQSNFHWNIDGNRVASELIADWLIDQQLVPLSQ